MSHQPIKTLLSLIVACICSSSALIGSTILYDNSNSAWTSNAGVSSYFYQAQSFHTGGEATFLYAISLGLLANNGTNASFLVQVYDGLYPGLGIPISTLDGPSNPGTGLISYTPSSSLALASDTTYWVVASASNASQIGTSIGWKLADQAPTIGTDSVRNMYDATYMANIWLGPQGSQDFMMKVEVIPEPSTLALFALSSSLLACARRRYKEKIIEQDIAPNDR